MKHMITKSICTHDLKGPNTHAVMQAIAKHVLEPAVNGIVDGLTTEDIPMIEVNWEVERDTVGHFKFTIL